MLSSNNQKEQIRKQELKKQRFTIKKLTVGVASVLIGFTFMGLSASANTTETPVVSKPAIVPDSPSGVNFSDTPASSTTTTVPESSADSSTPKHPVIHMTYHYSSMVTIETPDGQTILHSISNSQ